MPGTDKDGRRRLVAQLDPSKRPECAAVGTPVADPRARASMPDVPPDNVAALVTMAAVLPLERLRAPPAGVDQRGWIDVWELRRDVVQGEDIPRPDDRCSFRQPPEETTPEDLDAAPQPCEQERERA